MKFFAALAIASLAVVSAQAPAACDPTKLVGIATGVAGKACSAATGYSAATLKIPVGDALAKVCADKDCQTLLADITAAVPTPCTFGGVEIKSTLIDKFPSACASVAGGAAPAADAAGSGASNATAVVTTPAPSAATESSAPADVEEVSASSMESSSEGSTAGGAATTPAASSTVPTPTPASSASTVAAATGAVVMAVAATLL